MSTTPTEDQLHEALRGRADSLDAAPLSLADVRTRARTIQRRRTAAAGVGIAAVLALLVPAGLAVTANAPRGEAPPATRVPSQVPSQVPSVASPVTVDVDGALPGEAASVPLLVDGDRLLVTGGEEVALPADYDQIAPYLDGWIAMRNEEGVRTVDVLGADLRVDDSASGDVLTVRDDGERVAFAAYDGVRWTVVNRDALGREQEIWTNLTPGPRNARVRTVGFLPGDEVVAAQIDPDDGTESGMIVTRGSDIEPLDGFLSLVGSSPATGLVAGQTEFTGDGSCSAVSDPRSGRAGMLWETCEHQLGAFSPNGSLLVGTSPYFDGLTFPTLSVLDSVTGEPVLDFDVPGAGTRAVGFTPEVVWEDDSTLLASIVDGDQHRVVRLGLDGSVEIVAGPITHDPFTPAYRRSPARME